MNGPDPLPAAQPSHRRTEKMREGRQADSDRRRQRVLATLAAATTSSDTVISVSAIARAAGVDRTFLYRHHDLLEKIHALETTPPGTTSTITRATLQADLLAAHERSARLQSRVHHLETRLSQALGEQTWRESGLGTPTDIDALNQKITHLEQQAIDLRLQLEEQAEDLTAARSTNRELMAQLNHSTRTR